LARILNADAGTPAAIFRSGNAGARCGAARLARLFCRASQGDPMRLLAVIMFGLMTAACNQEQDITGSTPVCAMRNYTSFNPRDMTQCVAACKACDHGNTVTCSTSCTLKGAH
jgi:hypothetical protein